jgi:hypothetical protein
MLPVFEAGVVIRVGDSLISNTIGLSGDDAEEVPPDMMFSMLLFAA